MMFRRCFTQWFLLLLGYGAAGFFAARLGLFRFVWNGDFTFMTSVIGVIFVLMVVLLGIASWKVDSDNKYANSVTVLGRSTAYVVTLFGLLGTAIGLMYQVAALGHLNVADAANVVQFIGTVGSSLSSALLSTATGIIASIGITAMNSNIEFFLDVHEDTEPNA